MRERDAARRSAPPSGPGWTREETLAADPLVPRTPLHRREVAVSLAALAAFHAIAAASHGRPGRARRRPSRVERLRWAVPRW